MIALLAALLSAHADTARCWDASVYDLDDDGYADDASLSADREDVPWTDPDDRMRCPAGYVAKRGDCDDGDPDVHPRRYEVYGDGVDDDCNGLVDDVRFQYYPGGNANTTTSFTMRAHVADADVVTAWRDRSGIKVGPGSHGLGYQVRWEALTDTGTDHLGALTKVTAFTDVGASHYVDVPVSGLPSTRAIRAKVQFYTWSTGIFGTTWTALGDESNWYWTTTDGTSVLSQARTDILLYGFYEYYLSEFVGNVGYMGHVYEDGSRYGADLGEAWCSEFYSWAAGHDLPTMGSISYTEPLLGWFEDEGAERDKLDAGWDVADVEAGAARGDYLAEDSDPDDDEDWNHSAMFLAWDSHLGRFWTLNGNGDTDVGGDGGSDYVQNRRGGDEVSIANVEPDIVAGWGWLTTGML
ncbi:MAG TPA: putative metal-binding motif-containing protein [Myxococcota bacterium]|nr:putative metal-binding motif-containing protein [Myxococcota bacterium]